MGASAVAAVIAKEKHIVDAFRRAGATSPTSALAPAAIGVAERLAFRALRRHAVLRETSPGAFYLDEASWQALRTTRRRIALGTLLLVLVTALFSWFAMR